jgi:micrococcal nuclease
MLIALAGASVCNRVQTPPIRSDLDGQRVRVVRVVDGDTLIIETLDGTSERLRLKGIDAPELSSDDAPAPQHFATESANYLRQRVEGRDVILQFDGTERRDRYGRLLGFVYVTENDCINLAMVRDGYAYADRRFDSFLRSKLGQAEGEARQKKRGLWATITPEQMPAWRQRWMKERGISPDLD